MPFYPEREDQCFMGVSCAIEKAKAVVLPVPYDATTSYGGGTRRGPAAIIDASRHIELYDLELNRETHTDLGIATLPELEPDTDSPAGTIRRVEKAVAELVRRRTFPLILGGEHSITLGAVSALAKRTANLSVLVIDAHADLRDSFEGSRNNHACVMRRVREKVKRVVQLGIRSLDRDEVGYIRRQKINTVFLAPDFDNQEVLKHLTKNVYLSIDLDCFDPSQMPAVGTPEPGGLYWYQVLYFLQDVFASRRVVGADIVELSPIPGNHAPDFFAAKLAYKLIGYRHFLNHNLIRDLRKQRERFE